MKGVFNLRPPSPKYTYTWDIDIVLNYLKDLGYNEFLSLKDLTQKLAILLMLLSGQRKNTLTSFSIHMDLTEEYCIFYPCKLLKHSGPNRLNDKFVYEAFKADIKLCPVNLLHEYCTRRRNLDINHNALFFTYGKPYREPSSDTVARWVKDIMQKSGINTNVFTPHSCRSASTSAAKTAGASMETILKHGTWKNENTFTKFYHRQLKDIVENIDNLLQQAMLNLFIYLYRFTRENLYCSPTVLITHQAPELSSLHYSVSTCESSELIKEVIGKKELYKNPFLIKLSSMTNF